MAEEQTADAVATIMATTSNGGLDKTTSAQARERPATIRRPLPKRSSGRSSLGLLILGVGDQLGWFTRQPLAEVEAVDF